MAVVVAEGRCVWLHVGGGFWPRRPCRGGNISWKGEERGSPLARNRDFVAHCSDWAMGSVSLGHVSFYIKALESDDNR